MGAKLWVYTPSDNPGVVLRFPAPSSPVFGYNILDWFLKSPLDRYRVSFVKSETIDGRVTDAVLLQPLVAGEFQFRRATLWFDRGDGLPRRIETDEGPQRRIVDLTTSIPTAPFPRRRSRSKCRAESRSSISNHLRSVRAPPSPSPRL